MWWLLKEPFFCFFAVLLQGKLFSDVFQQLLECSVFSEIPEPGDLVQVAGYVFIQRTRHRLQLLLDQSPHAFDGIGVCTTVGINKVFGLSANCRPTRWPTCLPTRRWDRILYLYPKSTELFFSYNSSMEKFELKFPQLIFSGNLFNRYKCFSHCFAHIGIDLLHFVGPVYGPLLTCLFSNQ